jgi:hypothetical protein
MIVVVIDPVGIVPMIDAEFVFAFDGHRVMGDGVKQARIGILLGRPVGDDGGLNAVLLQVEAKMQAAYAGTDDTDRLFHVHSS